MGHPNIIHRVDFHDFFTPFTIIVVRSFNKKWSIHFYSPLRRTFDNSVMFCQQLIIWTRASASKLRSFFAQITCCCKILPFFGCFCFFQDGWQKFWPLKKSLPFSSIDNRVNNITDEYSSIKQNEPFFTKSQKALTHGSRLKKTLLCYIFSSVHSFVGKFC